MIDLRSDTVSQPTDAMRRAMAEAEVGDDHYRQDPTVIALEEKAADLFGKEAAMFVFSATMANLVSLLSQTQRGQSVILEETSHIYNNEAGGLAAFGGLTPRTVKAERGRLTPAQVEAAIFSPAVHHPQTSLLCLENTHNSAGGVCSSARQTKALADTARSHGLKIHLDGARIFNSAVRQGESVRDLTAEVDSVTVCLTKGLGCPVGALVLGRRDFMMDARRWRQASGGGMRQAGIVAAAGIVALDTMVDRLAEDHSNARRLAAHLADAGLILDVAPDEVETNIVFAEIPSRLVDAEQFVMGLAEAGVRVNPPTDCRIRLITHHGVSADDIEAAGGITRSVLESLRHGGGARLEQGAP